MHVSPYILLSKPVERFFLYFHACKVYLSYKAGLLTLLCILFLFVVRVAIQLTSFFIICSIIYTFSGVNLIHYLFQQAIGIHLGTLHNYQQRLEIMLSVVQMNHTNTLKSALVYFLCKKLTKHCKPSNYERFF